MRGDDVTSLQERLLELGYDAGRADGILGPETEVGLRAFQRDYGLTADGTCGPATLRALRQLGRKVTGGRPQLLRQSASFVESGPHLIGRRHRRRPRARRRRDRLHRGGDHRGRPGLRPRLPHRGTARRRRRHRVPHPRPEPEPARSRERTAFANDARADLFISLHMEAHTSEHARGVASYYYGTGSGRLLHGGRAVRQPGPPRGRSRAPACSTSARTPRPGTCCG